MKTTNSQNENLQNESVGSSRQARFDEVVVYNELADQSVSKIHLLQQINSQLSQLDSMIHRRRFLLKQVSEIIVKD